MPPRPKPLRLPLSTFSAPPPAPASSSGASNRTVDAHLDLDAVAAADVARTLEGYGSAAKRQVKGAVGITRSPVPPAFSADAAPVQRIVPVHPIPSSSAYDLAPSAGVLEFELVQPLLDDDSLWNEVDRVLDSVAQVAREVNGGGGEGQMEVDGVSAAGASGAGQPTVVLSGLLPPPLPSNISPTLLPHQQFYQTYVRQLSALALVPGVCLKFLPPTILEAAGDGVGWWEDEEDLISVLTHYLIPALDSFGSHRILFGSSPVPLALAPAPGLTLTPAVASAQRNWYPLVLRLLAKLKLDRDSVGEIMAGSAGRVYGLDKDWSA